MLYIEVSISPAQAFELFLYILHSKQLLVQMMGCFIEDPKFISDWQFFPTAFEFGDSNIECYKSSVKMLHSQKHPLSVTMTDM